MLQVDLARLRAARRLTLDEQLPPDTALLEGDEVQLVEPLRVRLELQQAGSDVLARGQIEGRIAAQCRRCLKALELPLSEPVAVLYTPQAQEVGEAGDEEIYPLSPDARLLELSPMVREQLLLAAPQYAVCEDACKGLCPRCGVDRNEVECDCRIEELDQRWAPLRRLGRE